MVVSWLTSQFRTGPKQQPKKGAPIASYTMRTDPTALGGNARGDFRWSEKGSLPCDGAPSSLSEMAPLSPDKQGRVSGDREQDRWSGQSKRSRKVGWRAAAWRYRPRTWERPLNDACTCLGGDWIDARRANEVGRRRDARGRQDGAATGEFRRRPTNAGAFVEKLRRDDRSGGSELKDCLIPSIKSTVARNTDCARRPASARVTI
jgi:hypothetical protein